MTKEEAIKNIKAHCYFANLIPQAKEALDVAIKALEQEPCDDAISRQEVLDGIADLKKSPWFNDDTNGAKFIRKEAVEIIEDLCIKSLPPVTPQLKMGHWREDIDNNRRWDRVRFYCSECGNWQTYGKTDFCPNCGTKMEESEGRE